MTVFSMKQRTRFGTWNVRTMLEPTTLAQVGREFLKYKLEFLGLCETRWANYGEFTTPEGLSLIYSGKPANQSSFSGVGLLISKSAKRALMEWTPHSDRIITARFRTRVRNISCIQCYAPTDLATLEEKEAFYSQLTKITSSVRKGDIIILMGDFNAQVGGNNTNHELCMGRHGVGTRTENGALFTEICLENNLVIGGTLFPHRRVHKVTWVSPDKNTENQIDHIAISRKWRGSLLDVRNRRGADAGSDHHLLVGTIRLKVAAIKENQDPNAKVQRRFDTLKLQNDETRNRFVSALRSYHDIAGIFNNDNWDRVKRIFTDTAKEQIGYPERNRKQWISDETWELINKRRQAKNDVNSARTRTSKAANQDIYNNAHKSVKRSSRRDKRAWTENLARDAENAAATNRSRDLYKIAKKLCRPNNVAVAMPLKDSNGNIAVRSKDQLSIWHNHYKLLLSPIIDHNNYLQCTCQHHIERTDIIAEIPNTSEVVKAINKLKNFKSPGLDNIPPEVLKVDPETSAEIIFPIIEKFWLTETLHQELKEGVIINLPKKGNLTECKNWRGITLLSLVNKIIAYIINSRIAASLTPELRNEQAGFRASRSCIDHINSLRVIVEQSVEWRSPLFLVFIDFEKAFDRINHPSIWNALQCKGVPQKLIRLIKELYKGASCRVLHNKELSGNINITQGVRQGCTLSPLLFNIILDVIMKWVTEIKRGISWGLQGRLDDLDFADDICLLSHTYSEMAEKLAYLSNLALQTGLKINISKTKVLRINTKNHRPFQINGINLEDVDSFIYLGSAIAKDGGSSLDITNRILKAKQAYGQLKNVWKASHLSINTKLRLFSTNVQSVLLYGCETWNMRKKDVQALQSFINRCLRRLFKIFWPTMVSNQELWERAKTTAIHLQIRRRKWGWLGHILRRPLNDITRQAIDWNPQGSRRVGRPAKTWRMQTENEIKQLNKKWKEVKKIAENRSEWKELIVALCSLEELQD